LCQILRNGLTCYGRSAGIDKAQVAARLLDTYFKQIFEDGFFHADPHPGNLFVMPMVKADDRLGADVRKHEEEDTEDKDWDEEEW
jgi:hypothetical protein